jgi:hypothetical protein
MDRVVAHFSFKRFVGHHAIPLFPPLVYWTRYHSATHPLFDAPLANQSVLQLRYRRRALAYAYLLSFATGT